MQPLSNADLRMLAKTSWGRSNITYSFFAGDPAYRTQNQVSFIFGIQEGGDGNDTLSGDAGNDVMYGGAGDDVLNGGDGTGTLYGDDGHDQLFGGSSSDTLYGGRGDDTLSGGGSSDTLSGGDGADTYLFAKGDGVDTIDNAAVDAAQDRLLITGIRRGEIFFTRSGNDLRMAASSDQITVRNWFADPNNRIDSIETAEGLATTADEIDALVAGGGQVFQAVTSSELMLAQDTGEGGLIQTVSLSDVPASLNSATVDAYSLDQADFMQTPANPDTHVGTPWKTTPQVIRSASPVAPSAPGSVTAPVIGVATPLEQPEVAPMDSQRDDHAGSLNGLMEAARRFQLDDRNLSAPGSMIDGPADPSSAAVAHEGSYDSLRASGQLARLVAATATFGDLGSANLELEPRPFEGRVAERFHFGARAHVFLS